MKVTMELEVADVRCGDPAVMYATPPTPEQVIRAWAQDQLGTPLEAFIGQEYVGEVMFSHATITIAP